jgi:sarcosine oxidase, subunit beta
MARVVVAGAGAVGASIAYHLSLRGAMDVVLADRTEIASGATGKAMGGVRQQFTTEAEVRLAQASVRFFAELGAPLFHQVGYLFLATTESGLDQLEERRLAQLELGVPVERVDPSFVPGLAVDDVRGAVFCARDGVGDPVGVTLELVRRAAAMGVHVRERTPAEALERDVLVIACGAYSAPLAAGVGIDLPVRPLCRQLLETTPVADLPATLPMTVEAETGFHFRRRGARPVLAMADPAPRWGEPAWVDESLFADRLARLERRFPGASGARVERAWAGLYDMSPDAHPVIGWVGDGVYAACGFSGHGFMQAPAVGAAVAEELLQGASEFDLSPYRLDRFAADARFPETLVL